MTHLKVTTNTLLCRDLPSGFFLAVSSNKAPHAFAFPSYVLHD